MNERAVEIAQKHIQQANPSLWNGSSERPKDFDSRIITYPVDEDTELDISFGPHRRSAQPGKTGM